MRGCILWDKTIAPKGYGVAYIKETQSVAPAHRVAYEHVHGKIPDGLTVDHLCRTRACVNVTHMELVTNEENIMRGEGVGALNARKTHCDKGHEFNQANTYVYSYKQKRWRSCRVCRREADKRHYWRNK